MGMAAVRRGMVEERRADERAPAPAVDAGWASIVASPAGTSAAGGVTQLVGLLNRGHAAHGASTRRLPTEVRARLDADDDEMRRDTNSHSYRYSTEAFGVCGGG